MTPNTECQTPNTERPTPDAGRPTPEDDLLDRIAEQVVRRGMATPAAFFLELHRPLTFLAGQTTHLLTPFLAAVVGLENARRLAKLLEDPANVDRLLERLVRGEPAGPDLGGEPASVVNHGTS